MAGITKEEVREIVQQAFTEHEEQEQKRFDAAMAGLLHKLVPGGDAYPHREYHQRKLDAAKAEQEAWEARKRVYEMMVSRLASRGLEGAVNLLWVLIILGLMAVAAKLGFSFPDWAWSLIRGAS